jgi:hypothetical protein
VKRRYPIQELIIQQKKSGWHYSIAFIVMLFISFGLGNWYANYKHYNWSKERESLTKQVDRLNEQLALSIKQANDFERASQINKQSEELLKATNQNLQNDINELQTDLSFYRRILGPTRSGSPWVSVAELKWGAKPEKSHYRYRMVLIQTGTNHEWQEGDIQLAVVGLQDNKKAKFFVKNTANSKHSGALEYKFRYFQNLEGDVVLPENFIPQNVEVTLLPSKEGVTQTKETFAWKLEGKDYVENEGKDPTRKST